MIKSDKNKIFKCPKCGTESEKDKKYYYMVSYCNIVNTLKNNDPKMITNICPKCTYCEKQD